MFVFHLALSSIAKVDLLLDLSNHASHHRHERDICNTSHETSAVPEASVNESHDFANTCQTLHAVVESDETDITRVCCDIVVILNHKLGGRHGKSGAAERLDAQTTHVSLTAISDCVVAARRVSLTTFVVLRPVLSVDM